MLKNGLVLSYHISPCDATWEPQNDLSENQFKCGESKRNLSTIAFIWVDQNSSLPRKYRYNDTCMFNHFLNGISTVMSAYYRVQKTDVWVAIFASAIVNSQHRPSNIAVVFNVHLFAPANLPPHPPFFVKKSCARPRSSLFGAVKACFNV